jgi:hypothetical protein|tara:strand:- start:2874 stop:3080 length:207 start_codon:yes stop_codon:yes gene_type:complete
MDVVDFVHAYRKALNNRMDEITRVLSTGGAKDIEAYRSMCGEVQGISQALYEFDALLKKANYDDASST